MASANDISPEKVSPSNEVASPADSEHEHAAALPTGWMYRDRRVLGLRIPHYASPQIQIILLGFTCFLCPGMFNAVNGLGGGGQLDHSASDAANTALYSTFSVVGFFAGTFTNWLGVKPALAFGGIGYSIYVSAYLCYSHTANFGFIVFAGAWLGLCAGLLWSAQGAIMMSYPHEKSKGQSVAIFWSIFNLGGVIGALVPLGENIHVTTNSTVTDGTYIGFIVLTFLGALMAWTLVDAKKVVRDDGSRVILMKHPTVITEIKGLFETMLHDSWIFLLWPLFLASNWFYVYHFNDVNAAYFNTRTRALNNVLYWSSQIVGAGIFGFALDSSQFKRSTRARILWVVLFAFTFVVWGGGYQFQKGYTRAETSDPSYPTKDWSDGGYVGPMFLYIFYGMYDAAWQTSVYWLMGALSNNSRTLANYAGFYKGIQSAGAAITWRLDGLDNAPSFMAIFASCWGLLAGSLIIALPVILIRIKDTVPIEEDLKHSDETIEDVLGPERVVESPEVEKV